MIREKKRNGLCLVKDKLASIFQSAIQWSESIYVCILGECNENCMITMKYENVCKEAPFSV